MSHHRSRAGFTIVEIMVVVAIIGVLIGLLVPAMQGVKSRSRKTVETNNLRQVGVGWNLYSQNNTDWALPGFIEPEVQEAWRVRYQYPDGTTVPPGENYATDDNLAGPWTWRLLQYIDYDHKIIHGHIIDELEIDQSNFFIDEPEEFAYEPGFSYNGYYVGGWWEINPNVGGGSPVPKFVAAKDMNGSPAHVVAKSVSQIDQPAQRVVFCVSSLQKPGVYSNLPDDTPGYHIAVPNTLADEQQWQAGGLDAETIALGPTDVRAFTVAPIPLARYTDTIPIFRADGSTNTETAMGLMDQREWMNDTRDVGSELARHFRHTED